MFLEWSHMDFYSGHPSKNESQHRLINIYILEVFSLKRTIFLLPPTTHFISLLGKYLLVIRFILNYSTFLVGYAIIPFPVTTYSIFPEKLFGLPKTQLLIMEVLVVYPLPAAVPLSFWAKDLTSLRVPSEPWQYH